MCIRDDFVERENLNSFSYAMNLSRPRHQHLVEEKEEEDEALEMCRKLERWLRMNDIEIYGTRDDFFPSRNNTFPLHYPFFSGW